MTNVPVCSVLTNELTIYLLMMTDHETPTLLTNHLSCS